MLFILLSFLKILNILLSYFQVSPIIIMVPYDDWDSMVCYNRYELKLRDSVRKCKIEGTIKEE